MSDKKWHYAADGASHGPYTDAEFDAFIANGTIRANTMVWQEGMSDWEMLDKVRPGAGATGQASRYGEASHAQNAEASTFVGALKDGFARYVDFGTRSNRPQFWYWVLWMVIFGVVTAILDMMLFSSQIGVLNPLLSLATFLPSLAVTIRRLHDIGRSGWWYLLVFVPIVGWIALIVFYCTKGEEQPNQWGS